MLMCSKYNIPLSLVIKDGKMGCEPKLTVNFAIEWLYTYLSPQFISEQSIGHTSCHQDKREKNRAEMRREVRSCLSKYILSIHLDWDHAHHHLEQIHYHKTHVFRFGIGFLNISYLYLCKILLDFQFNVNFLMFFFCISVCCDNVALLRWLLILNLNWIQKSEIY